jgi:hypothetical protein
MRQGWIGMIGIAVPALLVAQTEGNPLTRIVKVRPCDGAPVELDAGAVCHLGRHNHPRDPSVWYGWSIWGSDRGRWFVYTLFGRPAPSQACAVSPVKDERDTAGDLAPRVEWLTSETFEFLPDLSRGCGVPRPTARLEVTTVELVPGSAKAFEKALAASQGELRRETLWYRLATGSETTHYVRLRPQPSFPAALAPGNDHALGDVKKFVRRATVEIWTVHPSMSLGLPP